MTAKTGFKCNHPLSIANNFFPSCGKVIRGRKPTDRQQQGHSSLGRLR